MDEFVQFQQVLDRHHIPYHARDPRPVQGPLLTIAHGDVSIVLVFDRTGTYVHLAVAHQQDEAEQHETHVKPTPGAEPAARRRSIGGWCRRG